MAKESADAIAMALGRAAAREPGSDWRRFYDPDTADQLAGEIAQLEAELDDPAGYPQWRDKRPFHDLTPAKAEWIKLRLRRRDLILEGNAHLGMRVTYRKTSWCKKGRGWPIVETVNPRGDLTRQPYRPVVWVNHIARQLGCRPADVHRALAVRPARERNVVPWIDQFLQSEVERRPVAGEIVAPPRSPHPPPAPQPPPAPAAPATSDRVDVVQIPAPAAKAPEVEPQGE